MRTILFTLLTLCCIFAMTADATERVALVIGNGDYANTKKRPNPIRDAEAVSTLLRKAGFTVFYVKDAEVDATYDGLEEFKRAVRNARVGLFYYAGHGIEVDGKNYLLPVDAKLRGASRIRIIAIDAVLSANFKTYV